MSKLWSKKDEMKNNVKAGVFLSFLVLSFVFNFGNAQGEEKRPWKQDLLYQVDANYPPFEFVRNGQLQGFDLEIARLIFQDSQYRVQYSYDVWDKVYQRLKNGEIDTCGLLAVIEHRKKDLLYTKPLLKTYLAVYGKKDLKLKYLHDLPRYRIGVQKGEYGQHYLRNILGLQEDYAYNNLEEGVEALNEGKIAVIFGNQEVINYFLIKHQLNTEIVAWLPNLFPTYLAYGINKNRPELVEYFNHRLDKLEKSGAYEALFLKYFYRHSDGYLAKVEREKYFWLALTGIALLGGLILLYLLFIKSKAMLKRATSKLDEEREWFRVALSSIGDGVIATDVAGRVIFINPVAEELTGLNWQEAVGSSVDQVFHILDEETRTKGVIPIKKVLAEKKVMGLTNHTILVSKDGQERPITDSAAPICNDGGEIIGVVMVFQDMTEKRQSEKALEQSVIKYHSLFEGANDGILLHDQDLIMDCNSKALAMLKASRADLIGASVYQFSPEFQLNRKFSLEEGKRRIEMSLGGKNQIFEWRYQTLDGRIFDAEVSMSLVQLEDRKLLQVIFRDISQKKLSEGLIRYQAYYDGLTNLPNRFLFYERLTEALKKACKQKKSLAVFFLDLDSFQNVNDTLGHHIGDLFLKEVAKRLIDLLEDEVVIARMGGDEFAVLLIDPENEEESTRLAQQILSIFTNAISVNGYELFLSTSIGVALYPEHGKEVDTLLKNADAAMYKSKALGRNGYQFYSQDMQEKALQKLTLEKDLRQAIQQKQLLNYYQPIVDLPTGRIVGWEALVRWQHPKKGLILPGEFIPVAEEVGLIFSIDETVLQESCRQSREWKEEAMISPIAVNLSAYQFRRPDLLERIAAISQELQMPPDCLELEITESVAIEDINYTLKTINGLKEMGIRIAIDDFGTGYSSLSYLRHFPVHALKLDRSFTKDLLHNHNTKAIVKAIVEVAHSLGLVVTAEGVETMEQLEFLKKIDCDRMQGYLFSQPLSPEEITKKTWFKENKFAF